MTKFGLIAEDLSDIQVLKILAKKVSGRSISSAQFVGKGCGPLKKKTPGWCKAFQRKGCTKILLVHDLDRNNAAILRASLEKVLASSSTLSHAVVIPVEELEAWLLSDTGAISEALGLKKAIKTVHHPETQVSPKEFIRDEVWKLSGKKCQYVNSVHNGLIAEFIDVAKIQKRCPSFKGFADFVQ